MRERGKTAIILDVSDVRQFRKNSMIISTKNRRKCFPSNFFVFSLEQRARARVRASLQKMIAAEACQSCRSRKNASKETLGQKYRLCYSREQTFQSYPTPSPIAHRRNLNHFIINSMCSLVKAAVAELSRRISGPSDSAAPALTSSPRPWSSSVRSMNAATPDTSSGVHW